MPRVKIDYVVSFSSEDPENPAANLLSWEAGRGRWLSARGEPAASVVLQLARACTICSLTIGAHQAALVEVLVGRSETPSEPYQVLVPSSVFLGPRESRGAEGAAGAERVRTFAQDALAAGARAQRWDRVRVVVTQPYNKHCKYGISFVHMFEPEPVPSSAPPALPLPEEEEEEMFRPGELFAQHRRATTTTDTGAQIRQATVQALRSDPDADTTLKKAHVPRGRASKGPGRGGPGPEAGGPRDKDELLYSRPHRRIDPLLQQHDADKRKNDTNTFTLKANESGEMDNSPSNGEEPSAGKTLQKNIERDKSDGCHHSRKVTPRKSDELSRRDGNRKRTHSNKKEGRSRPLEGVVFVVSGYENPRRARLREVAVSLGARPQREWGPACTHLICAFPNTPKMRGVQAAAGGARVPVVRAEWVDACAQARRRVPWRAHATDPAHRDHKHDSTSTESDTDDEIEKVLRQQKRQRSPPAPAPAPAPAGGASDEEDVQFVKDDRMQGNVTVESDSCDTEPPSPAPCGGRSAGGGELPALLEGLAFLITERNAAPMDARLLARYARAYGGHLLTAGEALARAAPYYVLCGARAGQGGEVEGGTRLRADWLWACHEARDLLPTDDYLLSDTSI